MATGLFVMISCFSDREQSLDRLCSTTLINVHLFPSKYYLKNRLCVVHVYSSSSPPFSVKCYENGTYMILMCDDCVKKKSTCMMWLWGSHGGEYEEYDPLRNAAAQQTICTSAVCTIFCQIQYLGTIVVSLFLNLLWVYWVGNLAEEKSLCLQQDVPHVALRDLHL
jgi:hypothetical protein